MDCPGSRNDQAFFIAEQVRTDRLQQLFRQSVSAVFGSYLAAIMLCWLCWDRFEHSVIFWWLAIWTVSTLLRISLFVAYVRSDESKRTPQHWERRSEEHTSELQSLMRISYAVFCSKKKIPHYQT